MAAGEIIELIPGGAIEYHWRFTVSRTPSSDLSSTSSTLTRPGFAAITDYYRSNRRPPSPRDVNRLEAVVSGQDPIERVER